jgi:predicted lipid-binding transport protein (Tim44 family)
MFGNIFKKAGIGSFVGGLFGGSAGAITGGTLGGLFGATDKDKKKKPGPYTGPTIQASTESPAYTQALEAERRKRAVLAAQDPNYQGSGRTLLGGGTSGGKTLLGQ